jgi:NADP-dependent 3-hydroxy acid dehydrogenase YdfG
MDKIIVITGGGEGLGKTIAKRLVAPERKYSDGASNNKVIIVGIKPEVMEPAGKELNCEYKICDITQVDQVKKTIEEIQQEHGQIDLLINNAGIWIEGLLEESDDKRIQEAFEVNCLGTIYMTKYALPKMKEKNEGTIMNIVSTAGLTAKTQRSVYNGSKWAMTGFTKCLQEELKGTNIRVMGFYPSFMNTTLFKNAGVEREDFNKALDPDELAKTIEFILTLEPTTSLTEVEIRNIKY